MRLKSSYRGFPIKGREEERLRNKGRVSESGDQSQWLHERLLQRPFRWITVAELGFHLTQGLCLEGKEANWFSSCLASAAQSDSNS